MRNWPGIASWTRSEPWVAVAERSDATVEAAVAGDGGFRRGPVGGARRAGVVGARGAGRPRPPGTIEGALLAHPLLGRAGSGPAVPVRRRDLVGPVRQSGSGVLRSRAADDQ